MLQLLSEVWNQQQYYFSHCYTLVDIQSKGKNVLHFQILEDMAWPHSIHSRVQKLHLHVQAEFWTGQVARSRENFLQQMKLHHCSCISLLNLQHILSIVKYSEQVKWSFISTSILFPHSHLVRLILRRKGMLTYFRRKREIIMFMLRIWFHTLQYV